MRVTDATDDKFATLTGSGTVVVVFYMAPDNSFKALQSSAEASSAAPGGLAFRPARWHRHSEDIRRAIASAAWNHSRAIKVVFADWAQCPVACGRFGIGGFPTSLILKDGVPVAEKLGGTQGGHRDSYRIERDRFAEWLSEHLS